MAQGAGGVEHVRPHAPRRRLAVALGDRGEDRAVLVVRVPDAVALAELGAAEGREPRADRQRLLGQEPVMGGGVEPFVELRFRPS